MKGISLKRDTFPAPQQITNEIKRISMPAKLEKCVQHVIDQGKDKSSAYAICSKSTGWKKAGKHKWKKGKQVYVSESAITKISTMLEEISKTELDKQVKNNTVKGGLIGLPIGAVAANYLLDGSPMRIPVGLEMGALLGGVGSNLGTKLHQYAKYKKYGNM
jgi:hypothetical protein